jgi:hypothetical protein
MFYHRIQNRFQKGEGIEFSMTEDYLRLLIEEKQLLDLIWEASPHQEAQKATLVRQMLVLAEIEDLKQPKKKFLGSS